MLKNVYLLAKIGVDAAENEPSQVDEVDLDQRVALVVGTPRGPRRPARSELPSQLRSRSTNSSPRLRIGEHRPFCRISRLFTELSGLEERPRN